MRFLVNLRLWQKMCVVSAVLVVPLAIAMWLLVGQLRAELAFTRRPPAFE